MMMMIKKKVLFTILFSGCLSLSAQNSITVHSQTTGQDEVIDLPESMTVSVDSLLRDWHAKNFLTPSNDCQMSGEVLTYPDSVYVDRLSRIPSVMELPYNEVVRQFIDMYSNRLRNSVSLMLGAGNFYMPLFEEALDLYGLPYELKYLPIIESALNPQATSRVGAAGLWQFMLSTGKLYGLEANSLVDERRDPIKSSYAAARYLRDLYDIFKDWNLVIAAYNCGPGNITKAIHRAGGETDYWAIYNYLPKETRGYVPAFIAANYIMNYYCYHNICPAETTLPPATDTLMVNRELHFQQIADMCHVDIERIRALNPQYKKDIIPGNSMPCILRLPQEEIHAILDAKDSIYNYRADELQKRKLVAIKEVNSSNLRGKGNSGGSRYKVRRGDTLSAIARKHHVTVKRLQQLNNLRGTSISAGQTLRLN